MEDTLIQERVAIGLRNGRDMQASPLRKLAALPSNARKRDQSLSFEHRPADLPTAPAVFNAMKNFDQKTSATLRQTYSVALTAWKNYYRHYGISFEESELIVTAGGSEALIFAMCAVADAGDEILVFEPSTRITMDLRRIANVRLVPVALSIENAFHLRPKT